MSQTYQESARVVMERCELLASFSEEPGRVTRRFATAPMHKVHKTLTGWLREAGMRRSANAEGGGQE